MPGANKRGVPKMVSRTARVVRTRSVRPRTVRKAPVSARRDLGQCLGSVPRLFGRHKVVLALLHALGGNETKINFQKLLFLFCRGMGGEPVYEFTPCKYGAFSFTSHADRRKLIREGLLAERTDGWKLTKRGRQVARMCAVEGVKEFAGQHRGLRGDKLIAETYRLAPYYAIRSSILRRVLKGDRATQRRIQHARPKRQPAPLSTVGYEGRTVEGYLNALLKAGVTLLCDVRRNPISRKYGFSKGALAEACEAVGIRYEHVPELGISSEYRRELNSQADYDRLFRDYKRTSLRRAKQRVVLSRIREWVKEKERVALTCYEAHHRQCHRHCVANALMRLPGRRIVARHL